MRCVIALLTLGALVMLSPMTASARGGPLSLYGPFSHQRPPTISRAGIPTPSLSASDFLSACGRGRYRDPTTHECRGPTDLRN